MNDYSKYKAKKTFYKGFEFKSNLEGRVATRFDELGFKWEYEPCCFRDKGFAGGQYTPDFYLPDCNLYVEVAGVWDDRHCQNYLRFRELNDKWHYAGIPSGDELDDAYKLYDYISLLAIDTDGNFIEVWENGDVPIARSWDGVLLCQCANCGKWWAQDMLGGWFCNHCKFADGDHVFKQVIDNIFD